MKNENQREQNLSAYIDGELPAAQAEEMQEALKSDETLARKLRSLQATRRMLREMPVRKAGPDFVARVLAAAERNELVTTSHQEPAEVPLSWARRLAVAAVLLISVGLGTVVSLSLWKPEGNQPDALAGGGGQAADIDAGPQLPDANDPGNEDSRHSYAVTSPSTGPVLKVVIRTPDVSNTSKDVIEKVLASNGLEPRVHGRSGGASFWLVNVPKSEIARVEKDLAGLSSRTIVMEDADSEDVSRILASVEPSMGPEASRNSDDLSPVEDEDAPYRRIDRILNQDRDLLDDGRGQADDSSANQDAGAEDSQTRRVTPVIIKVITDRDTPEEDN
jgi:hypothetical protein